MKEIQISIKDMVYQVLRKWRIMLVMVLVLAVVCGFGTSVMSALSSDSTDDADSNLTKSQKLEKVRQKHVERSQRTDKVRDRACVRVVQGICGSGVGNSALSEQFRQNGDRFVFCSDIYA